MLSIFGVSLVLYFVKILSGSKKFKIITYVFAVAEFRVRRLLPLSWQCIYISQSPFLTTEWMYMMSYFRLFWYHVLYLSLHLQRSICTWSSESLSCESHIWWWLAYLSRIPQCDQISSYPILNLFGRKKGEEFRPFHRSCNKRVLWDVTLGPSICVKGKGQLFYCS